MVKRTLPVPIPGGTTSEIVIPLEAVVEILLETTQSQENFSNGAIQRAIKRLNSGKAGDFGKVTGDFYKRYPELFPHFDQTKAAEIEEWGVKTEPDIKRTQKVRTPKGWKTETVTIPGPAAANVAAWLEPSHAQNKQLATYIEQFLSETKLVTSSTAKGAGKRQDQILGFKLHGVDEVDPNRKYPTKFLKSEKLAGILHYGGTSPNNVMDLLTETVDDLNAGKFLAPDLEVPGGPKIAGFIDAPLEEIDTLENVGRQTLDTDTQRELKALSESDELVPDVSEVDKQMEKLKRLPGEFDPETPKHLVPTEGKVKPIRVKESAIIAFREANNDVMATLARYGPEDERNYLKAIWSRIAKNQPSAGGANVKKHEVRQIAHYLYLKGYLKQDPGFGDQLVNSELTSKQVPKNLFPTAKAMKEMGDDGESFKRILRPGQPLVITPEVEVKTKKPHSMVEDIKKRGSKGFGINVKGFGPWLGPLIGGTVAGGAALFGGAGVAKAGEAFVEGFNPFDIGAYPAGEGSTLFEGDPNIADVLGGTPTPREIEEKDFRKSQKEWAEHNTIMRANPGLVLPEGIRIVHNMFSPPEIEEMLRDAELKQVEEGMANKPGPLKFEQEQYKNTPLKLPQ